MQIVYLCVGMYNTPVRAKRERQTDLDDKQGKKEREARACTHIHTRELGEREEEDTFRYSLVSSRRFWFSRLVSVAGSLAANLSVFMLNQRV